MCRMGVVIEVVKYLIYVAVLGMMVYARGLYLELQTTKGELKKAEETVKELTEELSKYNKE